MQLCRKFLLLFFRRWRGGGETETMCFTARLKFGFRVWAFLWHTQYTHTLRIIITTNVKSTHWCTSLYRTAVITTVSWFIRTAMIMDLYLLQVHGHDAAILAGLFASAKNRCDRDWLTSHKAVCQATTLRALLFGTFLQRKDVVNHCLGFARPLDWVIGKLQALVYDILPSTTAVFSYAIGSRKLSDNEQFFVGSQTVLSLLQTTQIKQGV